MNRIARQELLSLALILLIAATLRIGWPTLTEFKFSEARLEALALELTQEGRLPLVGVPSSAGFDHSPLSVYLYVPAFAWTTNPIPATIYGGLVNVAAVALCWFLGRRWPGGGRRAAVVASLLLAVSPWSVVASRKIWQVAFIPLLTLAFVGWIVSGLVGCRRWSLCWALLTYAVLIQVHPSALSLAPALLLWLIVFRRQVRLAPLLVGTVLGLATAVPYLIHQIQAGWPILSPASTSTGNWDLAALRLAWDVITGRGLATLAGKAYPSLKLVPQLTWTYNVLGWLAVLALCWLAGRMLSEWVKRHSQHQRATGVAFVLTTWIAVPVAINLWHSVDLYWHFFLLLAPAACLILGLSIQAITTRPGRGRMDQRLVPIIGIGLVAALTVVAVLQATGLVLMGRFVATHDTAGGFGTPLGHYMRVAARAVSMAKQSQDGEVLVVGQGDSVVVDEIPAVFDVLLRGKVPYRFVDGRVAALFPEQQSIALVAPEPGEAAAWYESVPVAQVETGFRLLRLDGGSPELPLTRIAGTSRLRNGIELRGYAWKPASSSGSPAHFSLLWHVIEQSPDDTHFFVHLVNQEGVLLGQHDMAGYPAAARHKGDEIINIFDITLGPDSSLESFCWARVGMYIYPEITSVPVIDAAGSPIADAVIVGPLPSNP